MNQPLSKQDFNALNPEESTQSLEAGQVLFFPEHCFKAIDQSLMTSSILDGKHKNVSYNPQTDQLGGHSIISQAQEDKLRLMMRAYSDFSFKLIEKALPHYVPHLQWGRTSFRPAEIKGRQSSKRRDDTRLHVDSFAASPVAGLRILRVFCNVNPCNEPRIWHIGESFAQVLAHFSTKIAPYSKLWAHCLKWIRATKKLRTPYDHYMLQLHDGMKLDDVYQAEAPKQRIDFPAESSWIVFTDQVSHAALSGSFLLEQTFYLPVMHMADPLRSPWHQLESLGLKLSA